MTPATVVWQGERSDLEQGISNTNVSTASQSRTRLWWKRPLDAALSGALLLVTAPLMGVLALLIRLESHGPAFYRQERVGLDGQLFTIFKLRTMLVDCDELQHRQVAANWFAGGKTAGTLCPGTSRAGGAGVGRPKILPRFLER